jgi:hypothetical protein
VCGNEEKGLAPHRTPKIIVLLLLIATPITTVVLTRLPTAVYTSTFKIFKTLARTCDCGGVGTHEAICDSESIACNRRV